MIALCSANGLTSAANPTKLLCVAMPAVIPTVDLELRADPIRLKAWIIEQAFDLGFTACGVTTPDTRDQIPYLQQFLDDGFAGNMTYLAEHMDKRANPALLWAGTRSVISLRMDYLVEPPPHRHIPDVPNHAIVARYARGRDYHKTVRSRTKQLADRIEAKIGSFISRPFVDSAPIFEKALAQNAGLGWTGKHTLLINKQAGSFFLLAELFTDLDLPVDSAVSAHCGSCTACMDICPTQAIVAPYRLDARLCIAYLTIEYKDSIPLELRRAIGNRVFGCDDCQLICPWNGFAKLSNEIDFKPRQGLDQIRLLDLWRWDEREFLARTEGSPLRRIGYAGLMRNVAIGLGNAPYSAEIIAALDAVRGQRGELVDEHLQWAMEEQHLKQQPT
jgi:epoxyqueuosine reductase